jgi:hypothetical protein
MMKLMCDCGCGHAITEYDAGQMPIIIQRGGLVMELRIVPGPTGERPHVRPTCARTAATEGDIVFPRASRSVDGALTHISELGVRSISAKLDQVAGSEADGDDRLSAIAAPIAGGATVAAR